MSITVNASPEPWIKFEDGPGYATYYRPGHQNKEPKLVKFQRITAPVGSSATNARDRYIVKIINGDTDADGVPRNNPSVCTVEFRLPRANDATLAVDLYDALIGLAAQAGHLDDLMQGLLPQAETL
jgi:hypothetical protein